MTWIIGQLVAFTLSALTLASLLLFWNESSLLETYRERWRSWIEAGQPVRLLLGDDDPNSADLVELAASPVGWPTWFRSKLGTLLTCPMCQSYHLSWAMLLYVTQIAPLGMLPDNRWWLLAWWLPLQLVGLGLYRKS